MTALFGDRPLPPYFPIFLRSVQASGVDGIIIGGNEADLKDILPSNIRHIPVTWDDLHALISNKLFDGTRLKGFLGASAYKVIDVKPLFGFLFQEYIQDYEFWAHVDNDAIYGNIAKLMNPLMDRYDIISPLVGYGQTRTYGPFTAYRNTLEFTEVFRLIDADLYETLNTAEFYSIDEWGHFPHDESNQFTTTNFPRSMSNVIEKYRETLSIRVGGRMHFGWDGQEYFDSCVWTIQAGRSITMIKSDKLTYEVAFCHYEYSKHTGATLLMEMPDRDRWNIQFNATSIMWSKNSGLLVADDLSN
jgi:hypothetical protein